MFKIGVCGFGTVGKNLVSHFLKYQDLISINCNEKITISVIADRSIEKKNIIAHYSSTNGKNLIWYWSKCRNK